MFRKCVRVGSVPWWKEPSTLLRVGVNVKRDETGAETGFDQCEYDIQASDLICVSSTRSGRIRLGCIPCESAMYLEA